MARWQSGYAAACKAVYLGSIPGRASSIPAWFPPREIFHRHSLHARVVKLVDTRDLKSLGASHTGSIPVPGTISMHATFERRLITLDIVCLEYFQ